MRYIASVSLAAFFAAACSGSSGPSPGLSGTGVLDFTPTFTGAVTTSGTCPVCGGLPGTDAGGTPSGPASYQALVVLLTDDPNVQTNCAVNSYALDPARYHYVTVQVVSTQTIAPGRYAIHSSLAQAGGASAYAYVAEMRPVDGGSLGLDYVNDDNATGTVVLTTTGDTASGTFTADGLEMFGGGPSQGNLTGSFVATSCPALAQSAFQSPCGGCPG
jgi:hypothetical protein